MGDYKFTDTEVAALYFINLLSVYCLWLFALLGFYEIKNYEQMHVIIISLSAFVMAFADLHFKAGTSVIIGCTVIKIYFFFRKEQ